MFYAIMFTGKRKYMLVTFNEKAQRDTVVKYSKGFMPIDVKQVYQYIDPKVMHLCIGKCGTVYNQDYVCCGKFESLYKPLHEQSAYRPEDSAPILMHKAKYKTVINATTAHIY